MTNPLLRHDRLVRWLHPVAWWTWAFGLAAAASSTVNPLLLLGLATSALLVMVTRGATAPWAASMKPMLQIAAILIVARMLLQSLLGAPMGTHIALRLPAVPMPSWLTGVRLGGVVTFESLAVGAAEGLRFAAILLCVAAATSVAAPSRLFRALPSRIGDVGTLLIVAATLVPHLVQDFRRTAAARRLRGRRIRGIRAAAASLTPVIEAALERSVQLAASMFSRGYGLPVRATRHRPDPWRPAESLVAARGASAGLLCLLGAGGGATLTIAPLQWPTLSPGALCAVAMAALPAFVTPRTPSTDFVEVV